MDLDNDNYEEWPDEQMDNSEPCNDFYMGYRNLFDDDRGGFRGRRYGYGPPPDFGPFWPPGPPDGPFMWGRGFGPDGPPIRKRPPRDRDNRSFRYLLRCGVPKECIKGLPRVLLNLMEPENCGVCAQSFDSFMTSRSHYISKNHLKNQKKWLAQQAEVGSTRPKERPLKARELYCELCDVQITSKVHADSHYAGKPHRAIVEGRKNPKNPYLLQKGMQGRVDQLIRREKKSLKLEASEEKLEAQQETKSKPVAAELYCDICKTSVTCTEQMTMHLNGKKHLAKEKQHILKMMKGGAPQNEKAAGNAEIADNAATEQNENCENEENWVDGSGAWDDDPQ